VVNPPGAGMPTIDNIYSIFIDILQQIDNYDLLYAPASGVAINWVTGGAFGTAGNTYKT